MKFLRLAPLASLLAVPFLFAAEPPKKDPSFDSFKFAGLPPDQAAPSMTTRDGFTVKLFAGEPEVQQPIAMALDARGRLWVAEAFTYPHKAPEGQGKDRIVVFDDPQGTGHFTKRTVFYEGLNLVSGMEVGYGGVFVGAAPNLLFIPMQDGDEPKATGEPRILLDGFGYQDTHETLNTFNWGPDGWLYGCHGVFTHSNVGNPNAPDTARVPINAGVWRYHPTRKVFEVFAEGTSNPWGVDFNDYGQAFVTACVIPHLYHIIQGAHYQRQAGQHFSEFVYDDIKTCADHLHYGTASPHAGNGRSGAFGGGHAHCGAMIYLGGAWPAEFRNQIFMNNIHGSRINMDLLERSGSGFVGHHGQDFLFANDQWSRILNLRYGPDGGVYMIDWYDKQTCHTTNDVAIDRSNGRIFKVNYSTDKPAGPTDLGAMSSAELVKLQLSPNDWYVRTARRLLAERGPDPATHAALAEMLRTNPDPTRQLRALWALHVSGGLTEEIALPLLKHENEYVRAWAVQLLCEQKQASPAAREAFAAMAKSDASPVVRLYLASGIQRLPVAQRWDVATALSTHAEDAADHNLPLMNWYATEPLVALDPARALRAGLTSPLPNLLRYTSRRTAALGTPAAFAALIEVLGQADEGKQVAILQGLNEALKPGSTARLPEGWEKLSAPWHTKPVLSDLATIISAKFGSEEARVALRTRLADATAPAGIRVTALETLIALKDKALAPVLQRLLQEPALRTPALKALATYDDPGTAGAILRIYGELNAAEKRDALTALASRPGSARELGTALAGEKIPAHDLTAEVVRQIRLLKLPEVNQILDERWGTVRDSPAELQQQIAHFREVYKLGGSDPGDPRRGRVIFARVCQQCHTLYNEGAKIGPDLTGSNRNNLEYLLENIVTPNAVIPNDYRATLVEAKDGRALFGIIKQQDEKSVSLATLAGPLTLARSDVKAMTTSEISMMPEGLLTALQDQEVRDLFQYLRGNTQVPLPEK